MSGSKTLLRLYVKSVQLRDACVDEIQAAIDKYNEARKTLAVSEDVKEKIMMSMMSVEDVGDVKPVIFPRDLADYCQVKHLLSALTGALYVTIYELLQALSAMAPCRQSILSIFTQSLIHTQIT